MKATGSVRRIDDLGRIVIPKEIRKTLHIREGDPLELYTMDGNTICFRKYQHNIAEDIFNLASDVDALDDFSEDNTEAARLLFNKIAKAAQELKKLD